MSIVGNNNKKLPVLDAGLEGMAAFRQLLKEKNIRTSNPATGKGLKDKLFVTYTVVASYENEGVLIEPKENEVFFHADIQTYDSTGHLNTGTTVFHVNRIALEQNGEDAVKAELNTVVAEKMRLLLNFKKVNG